MRVLRSGGKLIVPAAQAHLFQTRSLRSGARAGLTRRATEAPASVLVQYAEEVERAQHSQDGSLRRCTRTGVRKVG
jgi:hypothetical protein